MITIEFIEGESEKAREAKLQQVRAAIVAAAMAEGESVDYSAAHAASLIERLSAGGGEEREAAKRIAELEAQLAEAHQDRDASIFDAIFQIEEISKEHAEEKAALETELKLAQETIADLRDANERALKIAAEEANKRLAEVEAQLAAQAEDHTPLSAIETLFTAGVNQCLIDEEYSSRTECPYPPDSISRHWWTRGYAHQARAFRAVELQTELEQATKAIKAHAEFAADACKQVDIQTRRADSYARTAQACLRDAGPALVEARERIATLSAIAGAAVAMEIAGSARVKVGGLLDSGLAHLDAIRLLFDAQLQAMCAFQDAVAGYRARQSALEPARQAEGESEKMCVCGHLRVLHRDEYSLKCDDLECDCTEFADAATPGGGEGGEG